MPPAIKACFPLLGVAKLGKYTDAVTPRTNGIKEVISALVAMP
jgi:hypothetical protein